jgi:ion channel-forming bestrophin family protein
MWQNIPSMQSNINWLKSTFQYRNSVLPKVTTRVLFCGAFSVLIAYLHAKGYQVSVPILANIIPSVLIGLLLVFRTNTANDRFWEGRKLWGDINNSIRNLSRHIWIMHTNQEQIQDKREFLELLWLFALLVKDGLSNNLEKPLVNKQLKFVSLENQAKIQNGFSQPVVAATILQQKLMNYKAQGDLDMYETADAQKLLDILINSLGGCERIYKTPIPAAYSIHLKQMVLLYCLTLPFQFVGVLGWFSIPAVLVISYAVMGIEEIGLEIENPFGTDHNDLPLDAICAGIKSNLDDLMKPLV